MNKITMFCAIGCFCLTSCTEKKQDTAQPTERDTYVFGLKPDGDPINTYRDRDGNLWSKDNIFAPGPNGSIHDREYSSTSSYEDDIEDAYNEGYKKGYNDGSSSN